MCLYSEPLSIYGRGLHKFLTAVKLERLKKPAQFNAVSEHRTWSIWLRSYDMPDQNMVYQGLVALGKIGLSDVSILKHEKRGKRLRLVQIELRTRFLRQKLALRIYPKEVKTHRQIG